MALVIASAIAVGIVIVPPAWHEPIAINLLGLSAAFGALTFGMLILGIVDALWTRFIANPLSRDERGLRLDGQVVYGYALEGRAIRIIARRRKHGFVAHTIKPLLIARARALSALAHEGVPFVRPDCDAIGRGILRWGEDIELLPLLERAGLLNPAHPVFGQPQVPRPADQAAWRELCNALYLRPHERPLALMLATRCHA
ncbi:MAG: hypothetical protein KF696_06645 [Planctomycetes bacterium]|nr:hypothetical protein [Planctomycetota bacterium]MCW8137197.1 hypothetical protein [Planctomycetota bacterium]